MLLSALVETSQAVAATRKRTEKVRHLAELLRRLEGEDRDIGTGMLAGELRQGKIGVGYATLREVGGEPPAEEASLSLAAVDAEITAVAGESGPGSKGRRLERLRALMRALTADEQVFFLRVACGELRQGALEQLLLDAVAAAAELPPPAVRRARMLSADLGAVLSAALTEGLAGLERFTLEPFTPVHPMLAGTAQTVEEVLERHGTAYFEPKLDGARVQLHKVGDVVRVFSRRLHEVTAALPEAVELARTWPLDRVILDGEAIALDPEGQPLPFQTTMRRFGRRLDIDAMRKQIPLSLFFFDILLEDREVLIDRPTSERFARLDALIPAENRLERVRTDAPETAEAVFRDALEREQEGLVAKAPDASYAAGRRGNDWLKLKPAHTLDLVVLAAEDGSGRRRGWLSNLHLGARDPASGGFVMLGKTFKGLTDAMLEEQTAALEALAIRREGHVLHVRPERVVEVSFDGLQASPQYPAGLALRFARVKRHRPDKSAAEADTIDTIRGLAPPNAG